MAKQIVYGDPSRQGILRGGNSLDNAVKVTLGSKGRNISQLPEPPRHEPTAGGGMNGGLF